MKKTYAAMAMAALALVVLAAGCATTAKITPEEAVAAKVEAFKAAMIAKNLDGMMAVFSEKFEHYEWQDKAGAKDFMSQAIDMGYLDGIEVNTEDKELKIEGSTATVYPVEISGSFGSVTLELVFTDEAGNWMITGLDASGM